MDQLILRPLRLTDKDSFLQALAEWQKADLSYYCIHWDEVSTFEELVQMFENHSQGINLPDKFVPATTYYAFVGNKIVGRLTLRHQLSERLMSYGGNIGYGVNPSQRGKGYASQMLQQALVNAKKLGLDKVLLTVDEKNVGSTKVIEKNGGTYEDVLYNENTGITARKYWINI